MAILISCSCGKQFRAGDELAGQFIRCPFCTQVVVIAGQATLGGGPNTLPPNVMVPFTCACGKKLQAKAEFAGQVIGCPACGKRLLIPGADQGQPTVSYSAGEEFPARAVKAVASPRRRVLWPWAALVLLLLAGSGAVLWYFVLREKPAESGKEGKQGSEVVDLDFVPADGLSFGSFRLSSWWTSEAGIRVRQQLAAFNPAALVEKSLGVPPGNIQRIMAVMTGPEEFHFVIATVTPYDRSRVLAMVMPNAETRTENGKKLHVAPSPRPPQPEMAVHFAGPRVFLLGPVPALRKLLQQPVARTGLLSDALRLADSHQLVAALNLTTPEFREKLRQAAAGPEAKPFLPLLEAQTVVLTADLGDDLVVDLRLTFPGEAKAEKARESAVLALRLLELKIAALAKQIPPEAKEVKSLVLLVSSMLRSVKVEREGNVVHLRLETEKATLTQLINAIAPAVDKVRGAATRMVSQNNLRQLVLAMHNYADANQGAFPPAVIHKGLSWRVALLPYLEQEALYRRFHLDEPWDSPHNKKLLPLMPQVFAPPGNEAKDHHLTSYKVFTGPQTPFDGAKPFSLRGFTDGTSNTFLIVEAGPPVPWTKPEDVPYDPQGKFPDLTGPYAGGFFAALADGTVRWIANTVSEQTLRAAITPAGGEILGADWAP